MSSDGVETRSLRLEELGGFWRSARTPALRLLNPSHAAVRSDYLWERQTRRRPHACGNASCLLQRGRGNDRLGGSMPHIVGLRAWAGCFFPSANDEHRE